MVNPSYFFALARADANAEIGERGLEPGSEREEDEEDVLLSMSISVVVDDDEENAVFLPLPWEDDVAGGIRTIGMVRVVVVVLLVV